MKPYRLFLFLILLSTASCISKKQTADTLPTCVSGMIKTLQAKPPQNPPAEVWEWDVDGKRYYYFTAPCCDRYNTLCDDHCNRICAPSGGFSGKGDGKCGDISEKAQKKLIWKDTRTKAIEK